jgi:hypothetical protein
MPSFARVEEEDAFMRKLSGIRIFPLKRNTGRNSLIGSLLTAGKKPRQPRGGYRRIPWISPREALNKSSLSALLVKSG